jgi:phosphoglycerate dehydrogenase-like enzyme
MLILSWSLAGKVLREVFGMAPRVKWVHSRSAGLDSVLFPELVDQPRAAHQRKGSIQPVAGRVRTRRHSLFREGFPPHDPQPGGRALGSSSTWKRSHRQTVGIVGYGDIGRACASRAKAMGMHVLAVKRPRHRILPRPIASEVFPAGPDWMR